MEMLSTVRRLDLVPGCVPNPNRGEIQEHTSTCLLQPLLHLGFPAAQLRHRLESCVNPRVELCRELDREGLCGVFMPL